MMRDGRRPSREPMRHFEFGSAFEPDCPLCREFGETRVGPAASKGGVLFLDPASLQEARQCPCGLCSQFREGGLF